MTGEEILAYRKQLKIGRGVVSSDTGMSQSAIARCEKGQAKEGELETLVGYYDSLTNGAQGGPEPVTESAEPEPREPISAFRMQLAQFPKAEDKFVIERGSLTLLIDVCLYAWKAADAANDEDAATLAFDVLTQVRSVLGRPEEEEQEDAIGTPEEGARAGDDEPHPVALDVSAAGDGVGSA